ncbi:MAG: ABC transporter permease, partial [bacterium]
MREIIALARKDLKLLLRDKTGAFFVFFFPLIFAVFFGVIFSGGGGGTSAIPVALIDEDSTEASRAFAEILINSGELEILKTDRATAEDLVRRGKQTAFIVLPDCFGQRRENVFYGDAAIIEIGLDPSRKAEAAMLQGLLTGHYMKGFMTMFTDPTAARDQMQTGLDQIRELTGDDREQFVDLERFLVKLDTAFAELITAEKDSAAIDSMKTQSAETGWQPIKFAVSEVTLQRDGPKNSFEVSFPQALIWAMIGCAAAFGISLVVERTHGTLVRLRVMPIKLSQIL